MRRPYGDILIQGGTVIDGTGAAAVRADVGIRGDQIVAIGDLSGESAAQVIDARGKVVTLGFIEMHSHAGPDCWATPTMDSMLHQGINYL